MNAGYRPTHVVYEPLDFIAKLAALVPRPHKNLVVYHSVISPHARWRKRVVAYAREPQAAEPVAAAATDSTVAPHKRRQWADLMRRAFGYDLLNCSKCGLATSLHARQHAWIAIIVAYTNAEFCTRYNEPRNRVVELRAPGRLTRARLRGALPDSPKSSPLRS